MSPTQFHHVLNSLPTLFCLSSSKHSTDLTAPVSQPPQCPVVPGMLTQIISLPRWFGPGISFPGSHPSWAAGGQQACSGHKNMSSILLYLEPSTSIPLLLLKIKNFIDKIPSSLSWFQGEPLSKNQSGTSLVAQWLRIHLPMQGTQVRAMVWEDPTCRRATKPRRHNYWARAPQLLKHHNYWSLRTRTKSSPCSHNKRKPTCSSEDPTQPKIKKK